MDAKQTAEALSRWSQSLNSADSWGNPCAQYRYLMRLADKMLHAGAIDPMERFDMVELAMAAFCHYVEEVPQKWMHPASEYDVYNQAGEQVGSLSGSRYFLHAKGATPGPMDFFAQIIVDDGEQKIMTRHLTHYGVIHDRYIHTATGQRLVLVETQRRYEGEMRTRLDDPDVYRAIIDASLVALEQNDMAAYVELWEKENFSIFTQCSTCCDRFYLREDCQACDGRGFIEDPQCPSKLPKAFCSPPVTAIVE